MPFFGYGVRHADFLSIIFYETIGQLALKLIRNFKKTVENVNI